MDSPKSPGARLNYSCLVCAYSVASLDAEIVIRAHVVLTHGVDLKSGERPFQAISGCEYVPVPAKEIRPNDVLSGQRIDTVQNDKGIVYVVTEETELAIWEGETVNIKRDIDIA